MLTGMVLGLAVIGIYSLVESAVNIIKYKKEAVTATQK